jgi:hypothetical protein
MVEPIVLSRGRKLFVEAEIVAFTARLKQIPSPLTETLHVLDRLLLKLLPPPTGARRN